MKIISQLLICFIAFSTACQSQNSANVLEPIPFQTKINENPKAIILDVRTLEEVNEGYILNAVNVDYNGVNFKAEVAKLDPKATYLVYCRSGKRSANAAAYMRSMGFLLVYELNGGIISWKENKLPVVVVPPATEGKK